MLLIREGGRSSVNTFADACMGWGCTKLVYITKSLTSRQALTNSKTVNNHCSTSILHDVRGSHLSFARRSMGTTRILSSWSAEMKMLATPKRIRHCMQSRPQAPPPDTNNHFYAPQPNSLTRRGARCII